MTTTSAPPCPRVHHPAPLADTDGVVLTAEASRHLVRVLRLRIGDAIRLFDGRGGEYAARISDIDDPRAVRVTIESHEIIERESRLDLTLAQVVARGERMDLIVQKAVELGVRRIVPLTSRRCNVRLDERRAARRLEHWRGIVVSACEQCGRNRLPEVLPLVPIEAWLSRPGDRADRLVLAPSARRGLGRWADGRASDGPVTLLVGPEGGLTPDEIETCLANGFEAVGLGPRILRTETAGLAAIAALQALAGDLR